MRRHWPLLLLTLLLLLGCWAFASPLLYHHHRLARLPHRLSSWLGRASSPPLL